MKKLVVSLLSLGVVIALAVSAGAENTPSVTTAADSSKTETISPNITDALEILKSLAGLPSVFDNTEINPTINDALEILKKIANLPSEINPAVIVRDSTSGSSLPTETATTVTTPSVTTSPTTTTQQPRWIGCSVCNVNRVLALVIPSEPWICADCHSAATSVTTAPVTTAEPPEEVEINYYVAEHQHGIIVASPNHDQAFADKSLYADTGKVAIVIHTRNGSGSLRSIVDSVMIRGDRLSIRMTTHGACIQSDDISYQRFVLLIDHKDFEGVNHVSFNERQDGWTICGSWEACQDRTTGFGYRCNIPWFEEWYESKKWVDN
jgi:hypothetical protein